MFSNNFLYFFLHIKKLLQKILWKISKSFQRIKRKKTQYGCERYKNLPKNEKQKLVQYRKKYLNNEKKRLTIIIRN